MIGLVAALLSAISYATLYVAWASGAAPRRRRAHRIGACLLFGSSAWAFTFVEAGFGGPLMATLSWTLAASVVPLLHRTATRRGRSQLSRRREPPGARLAQ